MGEMVSGSPEVQHPVWPSGPVHESVVSSPASCRTSPLRACRTPGIHWQRCRSSSVRGTRRSSFCRLPRLSLEAALCLLKYDSNFLIVPKYELIYVVVAAFVGIINYHL